MALEADKRNLLIFFSIVGLVLIGTQVFSYNRLTKKAGSLRGTLTGRQLVQNMYWTLLVAVNQG